MRRFVLLLFPVVVRGGKRSTNMRQMSERKFSLKTQERRGQKEGGTNEGKGRRSKVTKCVLERALRACNHGSSGFVRWCSLRVGVMCVRGKRSLLD